ncbi:efflux RND transporter permease subunit [Stenotrophomonas maltophilia]|uniref:efflux RND transporter permease subunit n=1 Tax=Stenotrophomonas maltophilia TaxID=40324 RepID=UPI0008DCA7B9|nr:efflux RND transporter permease subunit [Stenotrophomonas maltophilia]OHY66915.1 multidrug transporter subunit MdtC [Stenotrophomonas maltophilia]
MAIDLSGPFVRRPVATTLIAVGIMLLGLLAFRMLPVASLPQVEFPTIAVTANLPGADPDTVASSLATPLERQFSAIAGITDMTSVSYSGSVRIVIQFDLARGVDGAARDVQAAINAAMSRLPSDMDGVPTYRKVNPAEAPIMALALTSQTDDSAALYDAASTLLQQKLLQTEGVGDVQVGGGALPAVRVELDGQRLSQYGIGLDQIRQLLNGANARRAKGSVQVGDAEYALAANDDLLQAAAYRDLVVRDNAGAVVRLSDLGSVTDSTQNVRSFGLMNGRPGVALIISKRPGANVVETVDRVRAQLPELQAAVPATMKLDVMLDRTQTIRASLHEVELTLVVSILLVIAVTAVFFRDWRATLVPAVAVPLSLLGTFAVMWALGYSMNILSLMALIVAAGFVVDDAIVVVENIMRHQQMGKSRVQAALDGAREVGFTVFSISVSLVAVFIPLLLMSGLVGRLFREFSVTLAAAVLVSMVISLTVTPMMSRMLLRPADDARHPDGQGASPDGFYGRTLRWTLQRPRLMAWATAAVVGLGLVVFAVMPKGFFPQQDTGLLLGQVYGPQNISFGQMRDRFSEVVRMLRGNPSVDQVIGVLGATGSSASNAGALYVTLKPLHDPRQDSADVVIDQLRKTFANEAGVQVTLQAVQDIGVGGRQSAGQYQFTLSADNRAALDVAAARVEQAMRKVSLITDVSSDLMDGSVEAQIEIDRPAAARLGVSAQAIDQALYDSFGQRLVSTIYREMNQYHVVMGLDPSQAGNPATLDQIYVTPGHGSELVPLSAIARWSVQKTSLSQSHQGQFPAVTLSYNLSPGASLGPAQRAIRQAVDALHLDPGIAAAPAGNAKAFADTVKTMPLLIVTALLAVYIVLGMLYESLRHPLTILSTLPSAGIGALIALAAGGFEFSIIALIGVILLIGIVKKNAILMIDFALQVERAEGLSPQEAILRASLVRLRPIMMTTLAAILGAVPLVIGSGYGSEFRQPLGVAIIGGLMLSQVLTLYSTPAIYVLMDRFGTLHRRTPP